MIARLQYALSGLYQITIVLKCHRGIVGCFLYSVVLLIYCKTSNIKNTQTMQSSSIVLCFYRDLGAHIDGYIAVVAQTIVVGASKVSSR